MSADCPSWITAQMIRDAASDNYQWYGILPEVFATNRVRNLQNIECEMNPDREDGKVAFGSCTQCDYDHDKWGKGNKVNVEDMQGRKPKDLAANERAFHFARVCRGRRGHVRRHAIATPADAWMRVSISKEAAERLRGA